MMPIVDTILHEITHQPFKYNELISCKLQELLIRIERSTITESTTSKALTFIKNYIDEKIKAGMFNLGYLPGSGNKALTTKRETTLPAVQSAIEMLDHDGILLVAVYPGHEEGNLEGIMLREYFSTLSRFEMSISQFQIVNSPTSPYFFIVEKK